MPSLNYLHNKEDLYHLSSLNSILDYLSSVPEEDHEKSPVWNHEFQVLGVDLKVARRAEELEKSGDDHEAEARELGMEVRGGEEVQILKARKSMREQKVRVQLKRRMLIVMPRWILRGIWVRNCRMT